MYLSVSQPEAEGLRNLGPLVQVTQSDVKEPVVLDVQGQEKMSVPAPKEKENLSCLLKSIQAFNQLGGAHPHWMRFYLPSLVHRFNCQSLLEASSETYLKIMLYQLSG